MRDRETQGRTYIRMTRQRCEILDRRCGTRGRSAYVEQSLAAIPELVYALQRCRDVVPPAHVAEIDRVLALVDSWVS